MAGRGEYGVRPGAAGPGGVGDGPGLGRDGLHQPGQLFRAGGVLQRSARPRHHLPGRARRRDDHLDARPAHLAGRAVRAGAVRGPVGVADPDAGAGARPGGRVVRHLVDHRVLRAAGDAQPVERLRGAGSRRLLRTRRAGPYRPLGVGRCRGRGGVGGVDAAARRVLALPAAGRRSAGGPALAAARAVRGPGGRPAAGLRRMGDRGVRPLRRLSGC